MDIQVRQREPASMRTEEPKRSSGGVGLSPQKVKIIVSVVLFVLAGIAIAWNFGLFESNPYADGTKTPLGVTPEEEEKMWEEAQRQRQITHPPDRTPPPAGS